MCPPDGKCAYSFATGNLPSNFQGKKITVKVWGKSSDGRVNLLTYEDQADSKIGPCGNIVTVPTNTPIPTVTNMSGDYDGDRDVDLADFERWKTKYLAGNLTLVEFGVWKKEYLK